MCLYIVHCLCSSEEAMMTARWYAAWILFLNVCVVFLMYGVWLTLSLTGRLALHNDVVELLAHKHSLTGLNLSSGNGLLVYEEGGAGGGSGGGGGATGSGSGSSSRYHKSSVTQRSVNYVSGNAVSGPMSMSSVINSNSSGGNNNSNSMSNNGFMVSGIELSETESGT